MKKWLKEPLLHFMLLGTMVFWIYSRVNATKDDDYQIVIDDDKINHISALWELQWKREPTFEEMKDLVDNYLHEEIMYKEALRLHLDHNDEIVKRRLSQKMEFMASDVTKLVEPATEENLQQYFEAHKEKYRVPATYSLQLVSFSRSNHQDPKAYAASTLAAVNTTDEYALANKGDQVMLPAAFEKASKFEISREIGEPFYEALDNQPLHKWIGPIASGFGEHLVFITEKEAAYLPGLNSVKKQVQRDYEYAVETDTKDAIYQDMKKKYKVVIASKHLDKKQEQELLANLNLAQQ